MDQPDQRFLLADLWLIHDVRSAKLDQLFHIVLDQLSRSAQLSRLNIPLVPKCLTDTSAGITGSCTDPSTNRAFLRPVGRFQDTSDPGGFGPKIFRHWCPGTQFGIWQRWIKPWQGGRLCLRNYVN